MLAVTVGVIRPSQIKDVCGISLRTAYRLAKDGKFPKPKKLGERASGWDVTEINEWLKSRKTSL